jgi:amidase
MNRRKFLGDSLFVSAVSVAGFDFLQGCTPAEKGDARNVLPTADSFSLSEITIEELHKKMAVGEATSESIVKSYLERIAAIDKGGVKLNSVIELNPDALSIARSLDVERQNGKMRGLLHGIPVLIKDNIDTGDQMMTTAGSLALEQHHAAKDAFIIAELRKSGAVILGKTNLSEWANFRSTRSSSGWSSRGGQTKNPYMLDRSPCGSSSGSGTAVAANLCAIAIGTETNGSIACPSSSNGIVGIKPTVGLWSRSGIIPISVTQDTAGPMARTVRDATILLGALTATDEMDATSASAKGKALTDYTKFLNSEGLKGKTIGVEKSFMKGHEAIDLLLNKALDAMRLKGATVIEVELIDKLKDPEGDELKLLEFEFKDGLNKYLAQTNASVRSLQDVIDFNIKNENKMMSFFKQEIFLEAQSKGALESKEYKEIFERLIIKTRRTIDELFLEKKLDAVCGPANGPAWCIDLVNGDFFTGYGMYSPAAIAGYPSITVPMGRVLGLPVGLSFIGSAFSEPRLISLAYAYEQASLQRVPPDFKTEIV